MTQKLMGVALTVQMICLEGGELSTSIGIEGDAEVRTEALEFCEIERHSDGCSEPPRDSWRLFGLSQAAIVVA